MPVTGATTADSTLTAHPNGTFTLTQSLAPVRKRVSGRWVDLDPTLTKRPDGTIAPKATTSDLAFSGGGRGPLATMSSDGRSLAVSLPMTLPAPTLSGPTATYADVLPGVDLTVTANTQGGFSEVLTVRNATAAANPALTTLSLSTRAKGVTITSDKAGNITARGKGGQPVFTAPAPRMWDSATSATTAPTATSDSAAAGASPSPSPSPHASAAAGRRPVKDPITGQLVDPVSGQPVASSERGPGEGAHTAGIATRAAAGHIALTPNASLLHGAGTVYPVYIDPTFTAPSASSPLQAWTQTNSYYASSSYWKSSDLLRVGDQDWQSPTFVARSFVQIGVPSQLAGSTVLSSQINFTEEWSPSCTAKPVQLWQSGSISSATTWNNPPSLISQVGSQTVAHGYDSSCPAAGVGYDITSTMASAVSGKWHDITFGLVAGDESDPYGWKEFANTISVSTTYDHTPSTPSSLTTSPTTSCQDDTVVGDGEVTLYAGVSDPDGGTLGSTFQVWPDSTPSDIIASSNPDDLTNQSGSTAVLVVPRSTLETAAGGQLTQFDWKVQVTDFKYTSSWSTTCHFSFDPTRPGAPVITQPSGATIGRPLSVTIDPPSGSTVPSSYVYQLNGANPVSATADSSGDATISITPTRPTNVLSVSSLSAGANYGDGAAINIYADDPPTVQGDGDMSGDGVPDLLTTGSTTNGLPPGLWLADGATDPGQTVGDGSLVTAADDIGVNGDAVGSHGSASDFTGATVVTGQFTDSGFEDVLSYHPSGTKAGDGSILAGMGDGSPLQAQDNQDSYNLYPMADPAGDNPTQLVNAGDTSGDGSPYPDLIGVNGDGLTLYTSLGITGFYLPSTTFTTASPDGTAWSDWTIATMQLPATGGGTSTAMFLWNQSTGQLTLWENLGVDGDGNLTYTAYPVATDWNTGADLTLQAADINGDGTPDLWTVGANKQVTANLFTNLSTSAAATDTATAQTLSTAGHTWALNDGMDGTITTAADTIGSGTTLDATASGNAAWQTGDLFSPDADLNDVNTTGTDGDTGYLSTGSGNPAISTTGDFTVSAWVKPQTLGTTILGQDGSNTSGFTLYTDAASQTWRFAMPQSDAVNPTTDVATASKLTAQIGAWTQLAATYSASTGTMTLYVNGVAAGTATHTSTWSAGGAFTIGAGLEGGTLGGYFQGDIADVQTFGQALDSTQLAALAATPYIPGGGTVIGQVSGDFDGNGKTDLAHLYNYGGGHLALTATLADASGDGGFSPSELIWNSTTAGSTMNNVYATAGDFNGDGKTDIALYFNYTDDSGNHDSVYVLYATGRGGFTAPTRVWDDTTFGPGTQYVTAGDFNGATVGGHRLDDLALYYHYSDDSGQHVGVFTMAADTNGDGGLAAPTRQWNDTTWGPNTAFVSAGDFNGDGKSDLALYYHYTDDSGQHDAIFTMTADSNGDGGLAAPAQIWNDTTWGPNTRMMVTGDFTGGGTDDIALFYNYTADNSWSVAIFTMNGDDPASPTSVWSNTGWGPNTQFMTAGDFNGDGKTDLALFYSYANYYPAVFTLTADSNGDGGFASPVRRFSDF